MLVRTWPAAMQKVEQPMPLHREEHTVAAAGAAGARLWSGGPLGGVDREALIEYRRLHQPSRLPSLLLEHAVGAQPLLT